MLHLLINSRGKREMVSVEFDKINNMLTELGLSKAIIIDDQLKVDRQTIINIINGDYDNEDFEVSDILKEFDYQADEVKKMQDFPDALLARLKTELPGIATSEISTFVRTVEGIFGKDNIKYYENANSTIECDSNTVLFLDYNLKGSQTTSERLTQVLSAKQTTNNRPRSIIFISNDDTFFIDSESFKMIEPNGKYRYFRELRTKQKDKEYKNSLYDYLNKAWLHDETSIANNLIQVLNNLLGGYKFFSLLNQLQDILSSSSEKVLGRFYLLNARSLQEIMKEKIAEEGESETSFLLGWLSRHIAKSVLQDEVSAERIFSSLQEIENWSTTSHELHEDLALKELIISEMWDESVNSRHLPIDFGDVYEITYNGEKRRAILLTQTCTLAIRRNGDRAGKIALLAIENKKKKDTKSGVVIDDWNGEKLVFDLDNTVSYPLELLDLTSTDKEGVSKFCLSKEDNDEFIRYSKLWSEGNKLLIKNLLESLRTTVSSNAVKNIIQIENMWIPLEEQDGTCVLPIKRLRRLDQQYAMYILQTAQAWWGRIGLPLNVNFINDYEKKNGQIYVNGKKFSGVFYIKKRLGKIVDVGVAIDELINAISGIYRSISRTQRELEKIKHNTNFARIHAMSGLKFLSVIQDLRGVQLLNDLNIYLELTNTAPCELNVYSLSDLQCFIDNDEITQFVDKMQINKGQLQCLVSKKFLEDSSLLGVIPDYESKMVPHDQLDTVVEVLLSSNSEKSPISYMFDGARLGFIFPTFDGERQSAAASDNLPEK